MPASSPKITQAILPVAGLGTRFLPWTKVVPKELLPLGNQPIIAHIVDECLACNIREVCFVISKGKEAITKYFEPAPELEEQLRNRNKLHQLEELKRYNEMKFTTVYQDEQLGDGHAISMAADWVTSDSVAVLFGDDLLKADESGLSQLIAAYNSVNNPQASIVALTNIPRELTKQYGIAAVEKGEGKAEKIIGLVEKPAPEDAPSTLGVVGRYIVPKSIIKELSTVQKGPAGEIRLIDALIAHLSEGTLYGVECEGERLDTGRPEGYQKAAAIYGAAIRGN